MHRHDAPQGTDNVLLDLGFDDVEGLSAKAALALKLNELIGQRGLSQAETAHGPPMRPLPSPRRAST